MSKFYDLEKMITFTRSIYPDVQCREAVSSRVGRPIFIVASEQSGRLGRGPTEYRAWGVAFRNTKTTVAMRGFHAT